MDLPLLVTCGCGTCRTVMRMAGTVSFVVRHSLLGKKSSRGEQLWRTRELGTQDGQKEPAMAKPTGTSNQSKQLSVQTAVG